MPTCIVTRAFHSDLGRLTRERRQRLWVAIYAFIDDILAMEAGEINRFRPGLRVKRVRGMPGLFEMSWAPDGRATFMWGESVQPGKRHVIWVRCGDHGILPR